MRSKFVLCILSIIKLQESFKCLKHEDMKQCCNIVLPLSVNVVYLLGLLLRFAGELEASQV